MSERNHEADEAQAGAEQYLTFRLGAEEYGVEILRVQCIQAWDAVTAIPNAPPWMLGVTNLRGAIVPIVDLRRRFELPQRAFGPTTVVIVARIATAGEARTVGMVVDAVSEVRSVHPDAIQPPPEFAGDVETRFLRGLACVDEQMLVLLDVDRLLHDCIEVDTVADDVPANSAA